MTVPGGEERTVYEVVVDGPARIKRRQVAHGLLNEYRRAA